MTLRPGLSALATVDCPATTADPESGRGPSCVEIIRTSFLADKSLLAGALVRLTASRPGSPNPSVSCHLLAMSPHPEIYASTTGILPILACHSFGPVLWTLEPLESTATVTGMSLTSNS